MQTKHTHQLLTLLLSAAVCVNICGCQSKTDTAETAQPAEVKAETTANKELKQVSVKEFTENIYIDGKHIKFPCTFGELCNSYDFADIQENVTNGTPVENTNLFRYSYSLYFHDSEYESRNKKCHIQCAVIAESQDKVNDSELIWLNFYPKEDHFEICGLNENSKFDDMISVLGNDYDTHGNDKYEYTEGNISIQIQIGEFDDWKQNDSFAKDRISHITWSVIDTKQGD